MKKKLLGLLLIVMCAFPVFAGGESEEAGSNEGAYKVGLIAQTFGTQSFNDDVADGLTAMEEQLGLETIAIEVPEVSDTANSLRTLIMQDCNILIIPQADYYDGMIEIAEEYPDVKFIYCENPGVQPFDNIMTMAYAENQGSFILGVLGGLLTETDNLGVVLAIKGNAVMEKFEYGFKAGAKSVNPNVTVQVAYTNSFSDPNLGNEVATAMYSKGADIVGCYAGACNLGVFNACKNAGEGNYCFGAAKGQFDQQPDKIVASLVKPIDKALYNIVNDYVTTGAFETSKPLTLGLANEGVVVKYTDMNDSLLELITDDMQSVLDSYAAKIGSGEITVPSNAAELNSFLK